MASRSIAVRIKTEKVIASLEASLEKMRQDKETEKARREKYDKDYEAWQNEVKKVAISMPKPKNLDRVSLNHRFGSAGKPQEVQIVVEVPANKIPPRPEAPETMADWEYRDAVENIENALRLLRMTDQEEVSTGTYNKIAKYL